MRSLFVNFEIGMLVYTEPEIAAIRAWIEDLMKECGPPIFTERRFPASVAEDLCRLAAPLL